MGFVEDAVSTVWEGVTGQTAAEGIAEGTKAQVAGQREALDYLKQTEALPQQYREQALGQLGEYYMPGGEAQSAEQMIQSIMRGQQFGALQGIGEQSIMRNASATGGLRSGNTQQALAQNDQQLMMQMLQERMGGIKGLAQLPSSSGQIAQQYANIGTAQGQSIANQAQAQQQGAQNLLNAGMMFAGGVI